MSVIGLKNSLKISELIVIELEVCPQANGLVFPEKFSTRIFFLINIFFFWYLV